MEKLMNEENEWDHSISVGVKERQADCIRMSTECLKLQHTLTHTHTTVLRLYGFCSEQPG